MWSRRVCLKTLRPSDRVLGWRWCGEGEGAQEGALTGHDGVSWYRANQSRVAHCRRRGQTCETGWGFGGESGQYRSVVAAIALLVVLDRLCVADSAGRCPRGCAWRLLRNLVAAAIFVYDLGAHVWWG